MYSNLCSLNIDCMDIFHSNHTENEPYVYTLLSVCINTYSNKFVPKVDDIQLYFIYEDFYFQIVLLLL